MDSQQYILGLEASAGQATAALMHEGRILAETCHDARHGHAAWMLTLARDCLQQAAVPIENLTAIIGGRGPGSFTGIRVALAAAKGLIIARRIPGYGLSSLAAMASAQIDGASPVVALADTRRGSVFAAVHDAEGEPLGEVMDLALDAVAVQITDLAERMASGRVTASGKIKVIGYLPDGLAATLSSAGIDASLHPASPTAASLCRYFSQIEAPEAAAYPLTPLYLSEPLLGPA